MNENKKIKKCKYCGAEIAKNVKVCPHCGGKNSKPIYKRIWFWLLMPIVIFIVLAIIAEITYPTDDFDETKVIDSQEISNENTLVPTIDKEVIYEGHDVVITATDIEQAENNWNVNMLIENNSNLNLGFNAHAYGVNGIMTGNNIYDMDYDVSAGKKANVTLEIPKQILDEYGINSIRCIDALFWAYDNDKHFKEFDTGQIEIKTSLYDGNHDIIQNNTIYNKDGIKVDFLYGDNNEFVYVVTNNTDSLFSFEVNEVNINDYTSSDDEYLLIGGTILKNCQHVVTIKVSDDFKKANSITDVKTLDWCMEVSPRDEIFDSYKVGPIVSDFN